MPARLSTLFQHVEKWHSVICNISTAKENVSVAAEITLGTSKQVREIQRLPVNAASPDSLRHKSMAKLQTQK